MLLYQVTIRDYLSFEDSLMATFRDWPNSFQGQNTQGYRLLESGNATGALPYLERAFELHPTHDLVTYNLADAYWHVGDHEACSAILIREVIVDGNRDRGFGRLAMRCNNPELSDQVRAAIDECTREHGEEVCADRQDWLAESMGLVEPSAD